MALKRAAARCSGSAGCAPNSGTLYPLCSLAILNPFLLMEIRFRPGRNCSGLGGAAAGIESIVSCGWAASAAHLQKCSPAANRSQGQWTMLKTDDWDEAVVLSILSRKWRRSSRYLILYTGLFDLYSAYSAYSAYFTIYNIFSIFFILCTFCTFTFCIFCKSFIRSHRWMDGRTTCLPVIRRAPMLALQQCLPVPLDQHRLPVTLDRAAAARMLPLPASYTVDCKIKLKSLLTTLSSLALHCRNWPWPICFNMQNMPENMQENMQNMTKNMQNMTKNMQDMTKNMQNNMQNMAKNMFKYAQYVIWYIETYCNIFCIFYILQYVQYVQNRPSHIVWHIVLHIGKHTATYYFAYSAYSAYCNMSNMSKIDPCILFDILFYILDIYMQYNMQHNFLICRICRSIWQIICQVLICMPDMYGLHIRHIGHIWHMYGPPTSLMWKKVTVLNSNRRKELSKFSKSSNTRFTEFTE